MSKFLVGIDVGSTTTKIMAIDENKKIYFSDYRRHNANQLKSIFFALSLLKKKFKDEDIEIKLCLTGSGSKLIAESLGVSYIQEVVANSLTLQDNYDNVGTAIELGGQDAKIIFFHKDENTGYLDVSDMRMNGSCAGGTGAFIDEVASILKVNIEDFNTLASQGNCVYDISGRCGVYAKTDIQPLLNQGIAKEDLALSSFHAIAKQTIGGLAQGLEIKSPVVFEGGPLTFNPKLIDVFKERLHLSDEDVIIPERSELVVAYGAALSLMTMFEDNEYQPISYYKEKISNIHHIKEEAPHTSEPFFKNDEEKKQFLDTHALKTIEPIKYDKKEINAFLGIDSGSTTTKFVLIDEDENILDSFYASNDGEPLMVAKKALINMREKYKKLGIKLHILDVGTTGYGETLFAKAFGLKTHQVETVAHVRAVEKYVKDATFVLDIGGQDMKAIWVENGTITNIVVNEACSSGCGSFLENYASSLNIPVERIAEAAFDSKDPAVLGSRCTVFMNSSIITEQRNGKKSEDIMAGLCRSIIANVFTKVIRISNLDSLGDRIVVQGGTFKNDAVLCALEQYIGKPVTRAPYPEIMGAIGIALITKEQYQADCPEFDLNQLDSFDFQREANVICPFCNNHCHRTVIRFSNGNSWITNNRCENGEILGDIKDETVRAQLKKKNKQKNQTPNLFDYREKLLFKNYDYTPLLNKNNIKIGLPRVLSYWDTMPFWTTFFKALGFDVVLSDKSTRDMYENGLQAVSSDTVCFPAKLVHGHIRNLKDKKVDRIFMPTITTIPSENTEETSQSMCAIVKGYPMVIRNSDNPEKWNIQYDNPLFHWYSDNDRNRQLPEYMKNTYGIDKNITLKAIEQADNAQKTFRNDLYKEGQRVLNMVEKENRYAVILASRPYQNDELVNHKLPDMLINMGIPVLTADCLEMANSVDLSQSRIDIVNNYHARMLSNAILAATNEHLQYIQVVSFGCGHDAYLSDEIIRLMKEISNKSPLVLKLDESDIQGPLRIRVRSFIETISRKDNQLDIHQLKDPYPVKLTKEDTKTKTVLMPNTSHAFSRIMSAAMAKQGIKAVPLEYGRERAIELGKRYVHNDICFPAQIVIGEALAALESGKYDIHNTAIAQGKYIGDCRLTHYTALTRKALDDAGYKDVPILTNDDVDYHNVHPGFKMSLASAMRIAFALPMIDILEELLRKIRPYELVVGSANEAFEKAMDYLVDGLEKHGINGAKNGFKKGIKVMKEIPYDRSELKPRVLIVGEYLLNFHPGANHDIEDYLEKNGFEIIEARMTDVIRKTYFYQDSQDKEYHIDRPIDKKVWYAVANNAFNVAHHLADSIAKEHPLFEKTTRIQDLTHDSDPIIHHTFDAGEGILIPGEILHHAKHGCKNFIILQPFGCLPNHVVGRGISKKIKELYPDVQVLPLDYDPDVSFANIENRLQMLIMNVKKT
ncbi:MAG: acyl-CoA dehydratase activase [Erysipelotrichaceae bacterium]|nr:acyl-CoA dehydratase activase [Erysipelotrichaceae bacterium]